MLDQFLVHSQVGSKVLTHPFNRVTLTYRDANLDLTPIAQITWGGGRRGQLWSQARTAIDTKAQQTLGMTGMNVKRKKYSSTFKTEWTSTFDTLGPSSASKFQAYCKLCWMDFSIEHSGKATVRGMLALKNTRMLSHRRELQTLPHSL